MVTYEEIGGVAVVLRIVGSRAAREEQRAVVDTADAAIRAVPDADGVLAPADRAWFAWSRGGARETLRLTVGLRDALGPRVADLARGLDARCRIAWGIWADRFVVPVGADGVPQLNEVAFGRIFDFPPDGEALVSETVFRANRRWEAFACVPLRRRERPPEYAYRPLGRKRPSALDHLRAPATSAYVGRAGDLARLDALWHARAERTQRAAVIGPPGAGKTRLVGEWLRRRTDARSASATFSIFGGDVGSFAEQLVELPEGRVDANALAARVRERVARDGAEVLVLDDLHWASDDARPFLRALVGALPERGLVVLLCSRPSGAAVVAELAPEVELRLPPLADGEIVALARSLGLADDGVAHAVAHAAGNPLFVEQFAAWAHERDPGGPSSSLRCARDDSAFADEGNSGGPSSSLRSARDDRGGPALSSRAQRTECAETRDSDDRCDGGAPSSSLRCAPDNDGESLRTLRDVLAARIERLRGVRLAELRRRAQAAGDAAARERVEREVGAIEDEVGRWLDRLETGDYAERADALAYLTALEGIGRELRVMAALFGLRPRPRSNRIDEALERLLLGNAASLLAHLRALRPANADEERALFRQALRAGACAFENEAWETAQAFFALALPWAPDGERGLVEEQLAACRRRIDPAALQPAQLGDVVARLALQPAVDAATLPEVWLGLALQTGDAMYYERAAATAEAVGDRAVAALARASLSRDPASLPSR